MPEYDADLARLVERAAELRDLLCAALEGGALDGDAAAIILDKLAEVDEALDAYGR